MFMLLAAIPALAAVWALGGRPSALVDHRWRGLWLAWSALAIKLAVFSPLGVHLPVAAIRPVHVLTYVLLLGFLVANRNAGLGLIALGLSLNLAAIVANGGVMPADDAAQRVVIADPSTVGHPLNTDIGSSRLLFFGDTMALPDWLPLTSSFSIGDALLALGLVWAAARLTTGMRPHRVRPAVERLVRRATARPGGVAASVLAVCGWAGVAVAGGWALTASGTGSAALVVLALSVTHALWALSSRAGALLGSRLARAAACVGMLAAAVVASTASPGLLLLLAPAAAVLTVSGGSGLGGLAAAAAGLPAGAILVSRLDVAAAVAIVAAVAAVAAAVSCFAAREGRGGSRVHRAGWFRVDPLEVPGLAGTGVGLVALGAAFATFPSWLADGAARDGSLVGLMGGALAIGAIFGTIAARALRLARGRLLFGISLMFCGCAAVLLRTATLPMTVLAGGVATGLCAAIAMRCAPVRVTARLRVLGWLAVAAGALAAGPGLLDTGGAVWAAAAALLLAGAVTAATAPGGRVVPARVDGQPAG